MQKKVLLIDDDEITHLINTRILNITSFAKETVVLFDGKEAIDYFQKLLEKDEPGKDAPDIVFLDINMPFMDGWDFLEVFSKFYVNEFPFIKIFILSSSVDPEDIAKSKTYPIVNDYIVKPLTREYLEMLKTKY